VEWGLKAAGTFTDIPRIMGNPSPNVAALRNWFNTGKRSISLNMQHPKARDLVWRLIDVSDILLDNFGPDSLQSWGFTFETVRARKPELIMVRTSLVGRTGPRAGAVGYGTGVVALAGWATMMGFPDDPPIGLGPAFPDSTSNCHHLLAAMLVALEHRHRTGEGQYIDLSQYESTIAWIGPAVLDYTANGTVWPQSANRHPAFAPHGVYPTSEPDRWIAIAVDQTTWPAFAGVAKATGLALDADRFASHQSRKENEDDLNALIAGWTARFDGRALQDRLQAAGIAAAIDATGPDLLADKQLTHRGHYQRIEHPEAGAILFERHPFELRGTPATLRRTPLVGEHNDEVLSSLLGLSDEDLAEAYVDGVIG
jgi:crotonobetainyl-CoA:carnitine CoA-transferase CaiB-like acyl-CoA transferase